MCCGIVSRHNIATIKLLQAVELLGVIIISLPQHLSSQPDEYTGLCYEPKMANLMNEIAVKLPDKWQDIGRGLGLEEYELKQIHEEHSWEQSTNSRYSCVFEKWQSGE